MSVEIRELTLAVSPRIGSVDALLVRPAGARWLWVLAHGAGAGMRHHVLEGLVSACSAHHIATFRYQFPYMQRGSKRPDTAEILQATVRSAVHAAGLVGEGLPLLAGGKSMGGRMTSQEQAERPLHGVRGLVFFGFPLHPVGAPAMNRGDHLARVHLPMLFLQGDRDRLADLHLLRTTLAPLGANTTLALLEGGDHDLRVAGRDAPTPEQVYAWAAGQVAAWADKHASH